jgi:hypothetical protein
MKALIKLELFGDNQCQMFSLYKKTTAFINKDLSEQTFGKNPSPSCWVAEITGFHPKYKFERKFLRGCKDYSKANSKGSRGVFVSFYPEYGKIYEVKSKYSWGSTDQYFCTFDENGCRRLTREEVVSWIKEKNH